LTSASRWADDDGPALAGLLEAERLGRGDDGDDAEAIEPGAGDGAGFDLPGQGGVLAGQPGVGVGEARAGKHVAGAGLDVLAADGLRGAEGQQDRREE
jgi:hypothetical protein